MKITSTKEVEKGEKEMNTFMKEMAAGANLGTTENGARAYKSTLNMVLDMFSLGGAYRNRSDEDCILLFKNAFEEDRNLALKCLFYLRDCRDGQGERRFFRTCFKWLANNYPDVARKNLENIPEYGRYDDIYCLFSTPLEEDALKLIKKEIANGLEIIGAFNELEQ